MENHYKPMESRFAAFLQRNDNSELAKKVVDDNKAEIDLYQKFKTACYPILPHGRIEAFPRMKHLEANKG